MVISIWMKVANFAPTRLIVTRNSWNCIWGQLFIAYATHNEGTCFGWDCGEKSNTEYYYVQVYEIYIIYM